MSASTLPSEVAPVRPKSSHGVKRWMLQYGGKLAFDEQRRTHRDRLGEMLTSAAEVLRPWICGGLRGVFLKGETRVLKS